MGFRQWVEISVDESWYLVSSSCYLNEMGEKMEQLGRSIDRLLARKSGKMKRTSLGNNNRDWFALRRTRLLIQCKTVCVQHGKESIRSHVLRRRHRKTKAQDREWRKAGERTSDPFFFFPARNRTCSACWSHHQTQLDPSRHALNS